MLTVKSMIVTFSIKIASTMHFAGIKYPFCALRWAVKSVLMYSSEVSTGSHNVLEVSMVNL